MSWLPLCLILISIWQIATAAVTPEGHLILEPISDENWGEIPQSMQSKRDAAYHFVKLLDREHFLWGAPQGSSQIVYANMTMYTADNELVISMERFASDLKDVNCGSNMVMTFKSSTTFQAAIAEWSWVNLNENRTFIIIANYEGCGQKQSRKPWLVSSVSYDSTELKVFLNATEKEWKEVAHTYKLDWGRFLPSPPGNVSSADRRSLIDWNPSFAVDLNQKFRDDFFPTATLGPFSFTIGCNECASTGTLQFAGHVESDIVNGLSAFSISAVPHGVAVGFNLQFNVSGSLPGGGWNKAWDLGAIGIPGFTIDEVLKVGPNINVAAGFNLSAWHGSATLSSGITASIPDQSLAEVDMFAKKTVQIYGWQPAFHATPLDISVAIGLGLELFIQTSTELSLDCLGNGFNIGLGLKLPDINITGDVKYGTNGACKGSKDPFGIEIGATAGANLSLLGYDELEGTRNYYLNKPLFQVAPDFFKWGPFCLPFGSILGGSGTPISSTSTAANVSPSSSSLPSNLGPASCKTTGDGLRYRVCPNTGANCPAMGQYPIGTLIYFACYSQGEQINGDWATNTWGKTADGYFVSLAYVDQACAKTLPPC